MRCCTCAWAHGMQLQLLILVVPAAPAGREATPWLQSSGGRMRASPPARFQAGVDHRIISKCVVRACCCCTLPALCSTCWRHGQGAQATAGGGESVQVRRVMATSSMILRASSQRLRTLGASRSSGTPAPRWLSTSCRAQEPAASGGQGDANAMHHTLPARPEALDHRMARPRLAAGMHVCACRRRRC